MSPEPAPVVDWTTDFDHLDPAWVTDPFPVWDDLRARCPVAHTQRYGGTWLPTSHELVSAVAYDTEHFSSFGVVVSEGFTGEPDGIGGAPPITSDPPLHHDIRRILLPAFSAKAVERWEGETRSVCRGLLAGVEAGATFDVAHDYARHIPSGVMAHMLGLPDDDQDYFREVIHLVLEQITGEPGSYDAESKEFDAYLDRHIDAHRAEPRDDLIGFLLRQELFGEPLAQEHVRGMVALLLIAGIDTTWSAIGASLWHLAQHPADRERLLADPAAMPLAVEELLRAYAPVTMARRVKADVELAGRQLRPGEWVLLPFPAANRDPEVFERAGEVVLDRAENRHAAFGLGIHRCVGSNLARMELRIAVEEFLARVPDFELADAASVTWSRGQVRGPRHALVRVRATR